MLPPGSRMIRDERRSLSLRTPEGGLIPIEGRGLDLTDPMTRGIAEILDGRAPAGAPEVALSEAAADRLDVRIGGEVFGVDGTAWRVVGVVRFPGTYGEVLTYRPGALPGLPPVDPPDRTWLVDTGSPVTWAQVQRLNTIGLLAESRSVLLDPPPGVRNDDSDTTGLTREDLADFGSTVLVGGLGVLEIVLLAGPAFAVGVRTRRRELALIAANGGTPAHLRRVVLADGVVLGAVGAAAGVAAGVGVAFAAQPLTERYVYQAYAGGFRVFPAALLVICVAADRHRGAGRAGSRRHRRPAAGGGRADRPARRRPVAAALAGARPRDDGHRRRPGHLGRVERTLRADHARAGDRRSRAGVVHTVAARACSHGSGTGCR